MYTVRHTEIEGLRETCKFDHVEDETITYFKGRPTEFVRAVWNYNYIILLYILCYIRLNWGHTVA